MLFARRLLARIIMADRALWTTGELIAATGGRLEGSVVHPMTGVSIDTRTLARGEIFVAIKGDKHDGHEFVAKALASGAGLAVVSHPTDDMKSAGPLLIVDGDPLDAMIAIGRASRARCHAQVIGVTGSVGKTSTKEMLRTALSASGMTHASAASYNNHWGVPLTLARMPRETAYGVFEIGMNHANEIAPLVGMVRPHVAIITTVAPVHIGNFNSVEEIADAKAEIMSGIVPGGHAVLNRDNEHFERLAAAAKSYGVSNVVTFGEDAKADVRLERVGLHPTCSCITADIMGEKVIYKLGMPGKHMVLNSLSVLAAVKLAGADLARAALALAVSAAPKGRGVQHRLRAPGGEFLLIDESYNANPVSMMAALSLLKQAKTGKGGRRIAVMGDMLELGTHGPQLHAGLADSVMKNDIDLVFAAGPLMAHLWVKLPDRKQGAYASSSGELADGLLEQIHAGDAVMIKGSLGSRMGPLVAAIEKKFPPINPDA
jgi:UDP-N-acetylmuramoyl-tripeptide--D-alanyl-D-alanine ligase